MGTTLGGTIAVASDGSNYYAAGFDAGDQPNLWIYTSSDGESWQGDIALSAAAMQWKKVQRPPALCIWNGRPCLAATFVAGSPPNWTTEVWSGDGSNWQSVGEAQNIGNSPALAVHHDDGLMLFGREADGNGLSVYVIPAGGGAWDGPIPTGFYAYGVPTAASSKTDVGFAFNNNHDALAVVAGPPFNPLWEAPVNLAIYPIVWNDPIQQYQVGYLAYGPSFDLRSQDGSVAVAKPTSMARNVDAPALLAVGGQIRAYYLDISGSIQFVSFPKSQGREAGEEAGGTKAPAQSDFESAGPDRIEGEADAAIGNR